MKTSEFQQDIGGAVDCMERITKAAKGCDQISLKNTLFDDILFSAVKTAQEASAEGVYYCGPVKTSHKVFFLAKLEKSMKQWTGGSYLVTKSTPIFPGDIPLMGIR